MIYLQRPQGGNLQTEIVGSLRKLRYRNRRRYALLILSCYIDIKAIGRLVRKLAAEINLAEIHLAFELMEAWRNRTPADLERDLDQFRAVFGRDRDVKWWPVRLGALMHAKAYAVVQITKDGYGEGLVWIGSGNATGPGLGNRRTGRANVEMASLTVDQGSMRAFLDQWCWLIDRATSLDTALYHHDDQVFTYGLLSSGIYLHKWDGRMSERVSVRYALTPEGRRLVTVDPTLQAFGADIDQVTISRNPLSTVMEVAGQRALPRDFARNYTIDTLLGLWCPKIIWALAEEAVRASGEFQAFYDQFLAATEPKILERLSREEADAAREMVQRGLIVDQPDRAERWIAKIRSLRDNVGQLERLFLKFDAFELPYDFGDTENLNKLRESLFETLTLRERQSFVANKLREADATRSLSAIEMTSDEVDDVQRWLAERL